MGRPLVLFAVLFALIGLAIGADQVLAPTVDPSGATVTSGPAEAGAYTCAAGDTEQGNRLDLVMAAVAGSRSSETRIDLLSEGDVERGPEVEVFPTTGSTRRLPDGRAGVAVAARWWRNPAVLTRIWEVRQPGVPNGLVEGPCAPAPSTLWVIPGVTTAGGAQAYLTLANPFETDATLSIRLATTQGALDPVLLENVVVPRRSVRTLLVNEHRPEVADVGIVVQARSGRVVAEAYQVLDAAVGGIEGLSLVRATATASETWTGPWFQDDTPTSSTDPVAGAGAGDGVDPQAVATEGGDPGDGTEEAAASGAISGARSWLWITNPSDRAAAVTVTLHTVTGGVTPEGLEEVNVAPGAVHRVDLAGRLPDGPRRGGWTVRSENGVPVVASSATVVGGPDPDRTGVSIELGAPAPDALWVTSGRAGPARDAWLHLVNPTAEPATIDVNLWTGLGAVAPTPLQGVTLPPGAVIALDIGEHLDDRVTEVTAFVTATTGRVIVGRQAQEREGRLDLTSSLGVPSRLWSGGRTIGAVAFRAGLARRIGIVRDLVEDAVTPEEPVEPEQFVPESDAPTAPPSAPGDGASPEPTVTASEPAG